MGKANRANDLCLRGSGGHLYITDHSIFRSTHIWARRSNQPQILTSLGNVQMAQLVMPCLGGFDAVHNELGERPLDVEAA